MPRCQVFVVDGGVVDQHVDTAELFGGPFAEAVDARVVGHVELVWKDLCALRVDGVGGSLTLAGVTACQDDGGAAVGQLAHHLTADAAVAARDHRDERAHDGSPLGASRLKAFATSSPNASRSTIGSKYSVNRTSCPPRASNTPI